MAEKTDQEKIDEIQRSLEKELGGGSSPAAGPSPGTEEVISLENLMDMTEDTKVEVTTQKVAQSTNVNDDAISKLLDGAPVESPTPKEVPPVKVAPPEVKIAPQAEPPAPKVEEIAPKEDVAPPAVKEVEPSGQRGVQGFSYVAPPKPPAAPQAEKSNKSKTKVSEESRELTVEEIDGMLREADPSFVEKENEVAKSMTEEKEATPAVEGEEPEAPVIVSIERPPIKEVFKLIQGKAVVAFKSFALEIKSKPKATIKKVFGGIHSSVQSMLNYTRRQKVMFALLLLTIGMMAFVYKNRGHLIRFPRSQWANDYYEIAGQATKIDEKDEMVELKITEDSSEFTVLGPAVTVNIKRSESSSSNPMMNVQVYFEASSREAATEIKDREKEIRDLIQRIAENMTYDEMVRTPGKQKFKFHLRKELDEVINNGRIKAVYYKTILLKP